MKSLLIVLVVVGMVGGGLPLATPAVGAERPFRWVKVGGDPRCTKAFRSAADATNWFLSTRGQNDLTRIGLSDGEREEATVLVRNQGIAAVGMKRGGLVSWDGQNWQKAQIKNLTFGRAGTVIRANIQLVWTNVAQTVGYYPRGMYGWVPVAVSNCCNMVLIFRQPPAAQPPIPLIPAPPPVSVQPSPAPAPVPPPVPTPAPTPGYQACVWKGHAETWKALEGRLLGVGELSIRSQLHPTWSRRRTPAGQTVIWEQVFPGEVPYSVFVYVQDQQSAPCSPGLIRMRKVKTFTRREIQYDQAQRRWWVPYEITSDILVVWANGEEGLTRLWTPADSYCTTKAPDPQN